MADEGAGHRVGPLWAHRQCPGADLRVHARRRADPGRPDPRRRSPGKIPVGRLATTDDIAAAVAYLASPAGRMIKRPRPSRGWWLDRAVDNIHHGAERDGTTWRRRGRLTQPN